MTPLGSVNLRVKIFVPIFDPDGVGVSKGIGFLHKCVTPLGSVDLRVKIFVAMCDPVGVG